MRRANRAEEDASAVHSSGRDPWPGLVSETKHVFVLVGAAVDWWLRSESGL